MILENKDMSNVVNKELENIDWEGVAIQVEEEEKSTVVYDLETEMLTNDILEMKEWQDGEGRYGSW